MNKQTGEITLVALSAIAFLFMSGTIISATVPDKPDTQVEVDSQANQE